jgi:hypothetical protein
MNIETVTLPNGIILDVGILKQAALLKPTRCVLLSALRGLSRAPNTGFSKKRLLCADISYPIIVTKDLLVLDGRHRALHLLDIGAHSAICMELSDEEIASAQVH